MKLDIAYACDDAYLEQTIISMISLFENNKEANEILIWFIDMGICEESKKIMENTVLCYNRGIKFISFGEISFGANIANTGRHTASVYAKIFFDKLSDDLNRILYIDSDTIICGSLIDLFNADMSNFYIAGVETLHTKQQNLDMELNQEDRAINDGVLLMNLNKYREDNIREKCIQFINKYNGKPPVLSEGTLNAVCKGNIRILSPSYNLMSGIVNEQNHRLEVLTGRPYYSQEVLDEASKNPVIIHFLAGYYNRPWCKKCSHPLKSYYMYYRSKSPFKDAELKKVAFPLRLQVVGFLYKNLPIELFCWLRDMKSNVKLKSNLF